MPRTLRKEALVEVFDSGSVERALNICLRLQRMKQRCGKEMGSAPFRRRHLDDRNYHHMTPRCRRSEPYYGTDKRNMLLIHVPRHNAWHKVFKLQTLEETIAFLMACILGVREGYFALQMATTLYAARHRRIVKRRMAKWKG